MGVGKTIGECSEHKLRQFSKTIKAITHFNRRALWIPIIPYTHWSLDFDPKEMNVHLEQCLINKTF